MVEKLIKSDEEWKEILSEKQFDILRRGGGLKGPLKKEIYRERREMENFIVLLVIIIYLTLRISLTQGLVGLHLLNLLRVKAWNVVWRNKGGKKRIVLDVRAI